MEQKLKDLVVKDLCARLPYNVKCKISNDIEFPREKSIDEVLTPIGYEAFVNTLDCSAVNPFFVKPYLRPFSTMSEDEKEELLAIVREESSDIVEQLKNNDCGIKEGKYHFNSYKELDWILAHHFDYRGLIQMGLALEAPEDMYK